MDSLKHILTFVLMQTRPFENAKRWALLLSEEFCLQGDLERELRIPSLPINERGKVTLADFQLSFMKNVALDLYKSVGELFPNLKICVDNIEDNIKKWQQHTQMTLFVQTMLFTQTPIQNFIYYLPLYIFNHYYYHTLHLYLFIMKKAILNILSFVTKQTIRAANMLNNSNFLLRRVRLLLHVHSLASCIFDLYTSFTLHYVPYSVLSWPKSLNASSNNTDQPRI